MLRVSNCIWCDWHIKHREAFRTTVYYACGVQVSVYGFHPEELKLIQNTDDEIGEGK
jgi:hypothetical protein